MLFRSHLFQVFQQVLASEDWFSGWGSLARPPMHQEDATSDVCDAASPSAPSLYFHCVPCGFSVGGFEGGSVCVFAVLRLSLAAPFSALGNCCLIFSNCSVCTIATIKFGFVFTALGRVAVLCGNPCERFGGDLTLWAGVRSAAPAFALCVRS